MWKICTKCGKHKALWQFARHKDCLYSVDTTCKVCMAINSKKYRSTSRGKANNTKWLKENKTRRQHTTRKWYDNNKDSIVKRSKIYYDNNKDTILRRSKINMHGKATFQVFKNKLTIQEAPRLAKDGTSLEVKCKHCNKYFIPKRQDVYSRIAALNDECSRYGEANLYCSRECKVTCSVYYSNGSPKSASLREPIPQELREEVIKRADGMCERCGENPIENIHHEKPVSTHPHLQLDKDNLWGVCEECHYGLLHQLEGCSLPELRKKSINNCDTGVDK